MVDMSLPAKKDATGDVYHYVTFIYKNGAIWELDGLQLGPQRRSDADDTNYKTALMNVLQQRVTEISESDKSGNGQGISFNILLVVDDPIEKLEKSIAEAQAQGQPVDGMQAELEQLKAEKAEGREENKRRRHGYFPMIFDLLKALAEKDLLQPVIDDVKARKEANKK
ncbi:ubiquitin carboxyl-terminal hydrolase L5 [Angomonas deanei]|nr:ubiquitin carboxyl-terminal hydrolase L5 [Angomonas deanei]|eukprot:EPY30797.1 ubiquitin carboxyl-terminal hydrolase L5 [Angomonas deanei]